MGRYDQDFRFGSSNYKAAFFLVKLLEDNGYNGPRHFDSHAYRQSDLEDVKEFARGSMRTYSILKERAARWNADREIQDLLKLINVQDANLSKLTKRYSSGNAKKLLAAPLDRVELAKARLPYERLDQLTMEVITGVRQ
jgi:xylose isomerase